MRKPQQHMYPAFAGPITTVQVSGWGRMGSKFHKCLHVLNHMLAHTRTQEYPHRQLNRPAPKARAQPQMCNNTLILLPCVSSSIFIHTDNCTCTPHFIGQAPKGEGHL